MIYQRARNAAEMACGGKPVNIGGQAFPAHVEVPPSGGSSTFQQRRRAGPIPETVMDQSGRVHRHEQVQLDHCTRLFIRWLA